MRPFARVERERSRLQLRLERVTEIPMLLLAVVWIVLTAVDLASGLSEMLLRVQQTIWIVFLVEFGLRFAVAPRKASFLRRNWLTAVALVLPALRVLRVARLARVLRTARAVRGLRLARLLTSLNRGMRSLGRSLSRSGFGYVAALTLLVSIAGAAGMYGFERHQGLTSFADALWWTAMLMTTLGSEYWPKTAEGRILAFLLALYAFAVFGYVTAVLASFLVGQQSGPPRANMLTAAELRTLHAEIAELRAELRRLRPDDRSSGP
jgi:voltage-gated potassium channel